MKNDDREEREERAIEAIIAGCLRGFTEKDWQRVFKRMDEMSEEKPPEARCPVHYHHEADAMCTCPKKVPPTVSDRLAKELEESRKDLAHLQNIIADPVAVLVNMHRGTIATPKVFENIEARLAYAEDAAAKGEEGRKLGTAFEGLSADYETLRTALAAFLAVSVTERDGCFVVGPEFRTAQENARKLLSETPI